MHVCEKCNKEMKEEVQDLKIKGAIIKNVKMWACECGNGIISDEEFQRIEKIKPPFTWSNKMDERISQNGTLLFWLYGESANIQSMVQEISTQIGYKLDWAFQAGRAHVEVDVDGTEAAMKFLEENPDYWEQYGCRRIG